jgi:transposase
MLAETRPSHPTMMSAVRHVAGLLGMSPETLRLWQRRYEVDAGVKRLFPDEGVAGVGVAVPG